MVGLWRPTLIAYWKYKNLHNTQNKMDKTAINHYDCQPGYPEPCYATEFESQVQLDTENNSKYQKNIQFSPI